MKLRILLCLALASCCSLLSAQEDTLRTWKWSAPVSVLNITGDYLHVERSFPSGVKEVKVPLKDVESLRFADGFEVRFQDGELIRDNLLSAPRIRSTLWCVRVEEVIDLTREELRQYYGDRLFDLVYHPYRAQFFTGLGKIGVGAAGEWLVRKKLNPTVWRSGYYRSYSESFNGLDTRTYEKRIDFSYGNLYPGWTAVQYFFAGAIFAGVVDCSVSLIGMRSLVRRHATMNGPSLGWTKAGFWSGTALTVAGVGAMGLFASRLAAHRQWNHQVVTINGTVTDEVHEGGLPASRNDDLGLFVGALVANLGISAIQLSQARLSAFRKLDGTPYAMQVNLGPAPSGYGLTVRF